MTACEYVITRPDTPLPWINYLGSEAYFGLISNTAGGYSFYKDARLRRLTRYRYNNAPLDEGGRYIYIRDDGSRGAGLLVPDLAANPERTWILTNAGMAWDTPRSAPLPKVSQPQTRYFVPLGENLEIWELASHQPALRTRRSFRFFPLWNSACGTPWMTPTTSSATIPLVKWKLRTGSFTTNPNTANDATTLPTSPALSRWRVLIPNGMTSSGLTADGIPHWQLNRVKRMDSIALGWQPIGAHHVKMHLATRRNPQDHFPARLS